MEQLFIQNLKKWRKSMGLSQERLAEKCNTAHSYIRQLESGKGHPSFAMIGRIAEALLLEPYQLFYDETAESQPVNLKRLKSIQLELIETVSNNIQNAFDDIST